MEVKQENKENNFRPSRQNGLTFNVFNNWDLLKAKSTTPISKHDCLNNSPLKTWLPQQLLSQNMTASMTLLSKHDCPTTLLSKHDCPNNSPRKIWLPQQLSSQNMTTTTTQLACKKMIQTYTITIILNQQAQGSNASRSCTDKGFKTTMVPNITAQKKKIIDIKAEWGLKGKKLYMPPYFIYR